MARHVVGRSGINVPYFLRFGSSLLHRVSLVLHHKGWPFTGLPSSGSFRSFSVVRALPIPLSGLTESGFIRIGSLLSTLSFSMALPAIVPTFYYGHILPARGTTLTPPACGRPGTFVGTIIVPPILLLSAAYIACRSPLSSTPTGPVRLRVQHQAARLMLAVGSQVCNEERVTQVPDI